MTHAKTAEPIEMPFGLCARVGFRNHLLDWGPDSYMGKGNLEGEKWRPLCVKYMNAAVNCAKTAKTDRNTV